MEKQARINEILEKRNKSLDVDILAGYQEEPIPEPSPRFTKLINLYYQMKNTLDLEYTYWFNRAWWQAEGDLPEIRKAKATAAAQSHMTVSIWPGELLVGNKTRFWRGAFPYPWIDASFFNAQAEALMNNVEPPELSAADAVSVVGAGGGNITEDTSYAVSIASKFGLRRELIPTLVKIGQYWDTCSVERVTQRLSEVDPKYSAWKGYRDSVLCMFDNWAIPQGREVMNYYMPLEYGWDGLIEQCDEKIAKLWGRADNGDGILGTSRGYYYYAEKCLMEGTRKWIENYAYKAEELAEVTDDEQQKAEYLQIAADMHHIAHKKPETFRQALNLTLFCHYGVVNEDPQSGQSIGRLGQVLQLFYQDDIENGRTTDEEVIELLELYRIKITSIETFSSSGVTGGVLSGNTFNNLGVAGLAYDGQTGVTPLEYLIVEAGTRAQTTQPTISVLYDERTPEDFLMKACRCIKQGIGYPAFMNNRMGMDSMLRQFHQEGMTMVDARAWMLGGCLESSPGDWHLLHVNDKEMWVPGGAGPTAGSGIHFTGLPKLLELVLFNGLDNRTGIQVFPPHNKKLETWDELWEQVWEYLNKFWDDAIGINNIQLDYWRKMTPPMFASILKGDCFENGQHQGNMGAKYNATLGWESCGMITFINGLASLKYNVYDEKKWTLDEMKDAMLNNYGFKTAFETGVFSPDRREAGPDAEKYEKIYFDAVNAPKYGNADPRADQILKAYEDRLIIDLPKVISYYGKTYFSTQISVSTHGPQGAVTLAGADGRLCGTTYSDGSASPAANTDKNGIYAVFESATVYDHSMQQNSQMNVKIHPTAVKGQQGTRKLLDVVRAYMRKGGFHIQFNITSSDTLRKAQAKPDDYRDLMVRVAGFTQYWCEIGKPIQDEVIYRTEYDA